MSEPPHDVARIGCTSRTKSGAAAPNSATAAPPAVTPAAAEPPAVTPAPKTAAPAPERATPASRAGAAPASSVGPASARPAPARPREVKVKAGDTLRSLARTYGTSVEAIMYENNLTSDRIQVGKVLKLPARR